MRGSSATTNMATYPTRTPAWMPFVAPWGSNGRLIAILTWTPLPFGDCEHTRVGKTHYDQAQRNIRYCNVDCKREK